MPTYEYVCQTGHRYETREGFDAPPRQKCPTCRKPADRVLFAPPVVFKGSGFYKTDNRGSSSEASEPVPAASATPPTTGGADTHGSGGHAHDAPAKSTETTSTEAAAAS